MSHAEPHHHAAPTFDHAFAIGIGLNLLYVAVEAFYGWRVDSLALLADAGHNLSDVGGLALAWAALLAGRLRASPRRTYGWRRASILAAFANATLLLVAMGSLLWEALHRLHAPATTAGMTIVVVAAIGVVVNGITAALFLSGQPADLNLRGAFLHMAADTLVSLGVVASGVLYLWTAWSWLDPLTSIVIALVIVIGTWGLFRQSLNLLFDGVPEQVDLPAVAAWLRARPGVSEVHDLHIWAISTTETALSVHLIMPDGHPGDAFLNQTAAGLHDGFDIAHPTVQIELGQTGGGCAHPMHCPEPP
ncbi:cation diffusion facilitator family transporter [uncultured Thiocystis sp.]|jgi:cobalt-zinc-cadmium efflux system protein|uniref:cation diffusion facilitator family transporter n=1 Tax=uncultured Thiocystis sp. TaxID=1202134 RepID=UPI0025E94C8C|nr:cation diffusion facilitator family transporter [uncultured Thiocystis sp.]